MSVGKQAAVILRWGSFDEWYDHLESARRIKRDIQKINKLLASAGDAE